MYPYRILFIHPSSIYFFKLQFQAQWPSSGCWITIVINGSIYTFLSSYLPIYPSIRPPVYLSLCLSRYDSRTGGLWADAGLQLKLMDLSITFFQSIYLSIYPSIHPFIYLSIHPGTIPDLVAFGRMLDSN